MCETILQIELGVCRAGKHVSSICLTLRTWCFPSSILTTQVQLTRHLQLVPLDVLEPLTQSKQRLFADVHSLFRQCNGFSMEYCIPNVSDQSHVLLSNAFITVQNGCQYVWNATCVQTLAPSTSCCQFPKKNPEFQDLGFLCTEPWFMMNWVILIINWLCREVHWNVEPPKNVVIVKRFHWSKDGVPPLASCSACLPLNRGFLSGKLCWVI